MTDRPLIALLTDFGTTDHYVGVMKGVMKTICPNAEFIDITHHVPAQSVQAAAFTLMNAYDYFPKGTVFLIVVDPGVGTTRRPIVVQAEGYTFVAPDNGVLTYILSETVQSRPTTPMRWSGGTLRYAISANTPSTAWEINMDPDASQTFHGRDVFAPAAAQIAASRAGGPWDGRYFRRIEFNSLRSLSIPALTLDGDEITGEVLYIDHFGNIITSIGRLTWRGDQSALVFDPLLNAGLPKLIVSALSTIRVGNHTFEQIQHTYGEVNPGDSLTLIGSSKHLEIAINQGNAAQQLGIAIGDSVTLHIAEDT